MGDGRVALILDVLGLARMAGMTARDREVVRARTSSAARPAAAAEAARSFLLVGLGDERRMALPLDVVARDSRRSTPRPLSAPSAGRSSSTAATSFPWSGSPNGSRAASIPRERIQVVVASDRGRDVGLVVDSILDIVTETPELQDLGNRPGILGTAVLQHRVTDLLDIPSLIQGPNSASGGS